MSTEQPDLFTGEKVMGKITDYYNMSREKFMTMCTGCGACVENCRVMTFIENRPEADEVLDGFRGYFSGGDGNVALKLRTDACMRCYGCLDDYCPIGLDALLLNEIYWREQEFRTQEKPYSRVQFDNHDERRRRFTTPEELERISTVRIVPGARVAFFPGCNVYRQPDKILNALDIMDAIGEPYSFVPGMQYCCGQANRGSRGDSEWSQEAGEKLVAKLADTGAEKVVFWCPTCACHIKYRFKDFMEGLPFENISFGGYVLENIQKLDFKCARPCKVTLHEPCKTAYMGIDLEEIRNVLRAIPGTELVEMEHHHENTMCCGCRAVNSLPELGDSVTEMRLAEARETGADKMLDVCHNCHWIFRRYQDKTGVCDVNIENYSTYIAAALGIERADSMK